MRLRLHTCLLCALVLAACGVPEPPKSVAELTKLAAAGDEKALAKLFDLTGSQGKEAERSEAYIALLEAGPKVGAKRALELTRDADPIKREHALALTGNFKTPGAFDAATEALRDANFRRNHVAAWVLGELGDAKAVPFLLDALERGEPLLTAKESARALEKIGPNAVGQIVARLPALKGDPKAFALRILGEIKAPEAKPAIIGALQSPSTREDALWALGTMGAAGPAFDPKPYLADPDWRVRIQACRATGLLKTPGAAAALDRLRSQDKVVEVREWAARGLGLLQGEHEEFMAPGGEWKAPDQLYR